MLKTGCTISPSQFLPCCADCIEREVIPYAHLLQHDYRAIELINSFVPQSSVSKTNLNPAELKLVLLLDRR
jgi:hypothetical protein